MKKVTRDQCRCVKGTWKKNACYIPKRHIPKRCPIHGDKPKIFGFEPITVDNDESNKNRRTLYIHCDDIGEDLIIIDVETSKVLYVDSIMKKHC